MAIKVTLDYAPPSHERTRRAPRWLWMASGAVLSFGFVWFCVPYKLTGRSDAARISAARADTEALHVQLDAFKLDVGRYPTAAEGLSALLVEPSGIAGWRGPYLKRRPVDPWATPYAYIPPSATSPPRVISPGPDRQLGTSDDIASH
jgi:type II secretion system protein G